MKINFFVLEKKWTTQVRKWWTICIFGWPMQMNLDWTYTITWTIRYIFRSRNKLPLLHLNEIIHRASSVLEKSCGKAILHTAVRNFPSFQTIEYRVLELKEGDKKMANPYIGFQYEPSAISNLAILKSFYSLTKFQYVYVWAPLEFIRPTKNCTTI